MPIPNLDATHLDYHRGQILALRPDSQRLWGEMSVERMLRHLRTTIDLTLDDPEGQVKVVAPPVVRNVVGFLFFDLFTTWPQGKFKASPEFLPQDAGTFEEERAKLLTTCEEFARRWTLNPDEKHVHPLTGMTTLKRMARLHGVHMNHHYRQFGLV